MECKRCGKEIPDNSKFCKFCGHEISNERNFQKNIMLRFFCSNREKAINNMLYKMKIQLKNISLRSILIIIAVGIWMLVFQNLGLIPITQDVRVKNTVDVSGDVGISGNVDVSGSTVSID